MSKRSRRKSSVNSTGHAPHAVVRVVAGSIVLYAVLGTFALNLSQASAQGGASRHDGATHNTRVVRVNRQAFKEILLKGRRMAERGELRLDRPVELNLEADRDDDGTLANVIVGGSSLGDDKLRELLNDFAVALSASRVLGRLEEARHVWMTLRLDAATLSASFATEYPTEQRASERARGYGGLLAIARLLKKERAESVVYQNMKISSSGKRLAIKLEMSREAAGNLLLKQITPN
ncbi:MAG TPA: hypothetical protein VNA19_16390 [Pyrinomonadaceae bacterium]|jgi:hypothetical protein|nr:hypothetical protein [Pyrinomonadaceae bacterium]